jgi:hypothetical protein
VRDYKDKILEKEILDSEAWFVRFWAKDILRTPDLIANQLIRLGVTL